MTSGSIAYTPYGINLDSGYSINWGSVGSQAYIEAGNAGGSSYMGMGNVDAIYLQPLTHCVNGLSDASSLLSISPYNRQLIGTDGTTVMLDWSNYFSVNIPNGASLGVDMIFDADAPQRYIDVVNGVLGDYNANYTASIDWHSRQLLKSDGTTIALDWENHYLRDTVGYYSVDWANRQLIGTDGVTVAADWSTGTPAFAQGATFNPNTVAGLTATEGTISYVNDADTPVIGSAVVAGGSAKCLVCYNGTDHIVTALL
jgi:hypothetical protein